MPKRLPSLTALRTFEAAARHKSFSKAAEELLVTPAAVGFQIKRLEDEIGTPLFVRKHRAVELTPKGDALARNLAPAFDAITAAWQTVDTQDAGPVLKVTAPEDAVRHWLLPATTAAQSARPGPVLSWDASRRKRNFGSGDWDVALRYGLEPDDRYFYEPVLRSWFTPLARPEVGRHIRTGKDILNHGLINVEFGLDARDGDNAWPSFLKLMSLPSNPVFAMTCPDTRTAVEMAAETNNVALGGYFVAADHLRAGSLVNPIPKAILPKSRFWMICAKGRENTDEILWLRDAFHKGAEKLRITANDVELFELDGSPTKSVI